MIHESEWMRVYRTGPDTEILESKFARDGLEVSADSIKRRWPSLTLEEQVDFAQAFTLKPNLTAQDQEILAFLMEAGSELVWGTVAYLLPRFSDRERAMAFLLERVASGGRASGNYYQALGTIGNGRAVPLLRRHYEESRKALAPLEDRTMEELGDYLDCLGALWKLEGPRIYEGALEELLTHPDSEVRRAAQRRIAERRLQDPASLRAWHAAAPSPQDAERELIGETEWSRVYRTPTGDCWYRSKFRSGELAVSAGAVRDRWPRFRLEEQVEFAQAFCQKPAFTKEDCEILQLLIEAGLEYARTTSALQLRDHPDRDNFLSFLLPRAAAESKHAGNYFEFLRWLGDPQAVPALRERFQAYRTKLSPLEDQGLDELIAYLRCCQALWGLTASAEYRKPLEDLLAHPTEQVRREAQLLLPPQRS